MKIFLKVLIFIILIAGLFFLGVYLYGVITGQEFLPALKSIF